MAVKLPALILFAFVYFADNETNTEPNILNFKFPKD